MHHDSVCFFSKLDKYESYVLLFLASFHLAHPENVPVFSITAGDTDLHLKSKFAGKESSNLEIGEQNVFITKPTKCVLSKKLHNRVS